MIVLLRDSLLLLKSAEAVISCVVTCCLFGWPSILFDPCEAAITGRINEAQLLGQPAA
jgi:hypothetical protein